MPGPKKKPIPRRTYIPITLEDRYIAHPDAIAQTVYPITQRMEVEQRQHEFQKQQKKQAREAQDRKRRAWKAKKDAENSSGKSFSISHYLMTDPQIDQAIAAEERLSNGPRFEQGYENPNYNLDQLASQYANLQSFYNALGSPNIMPMSEHQVRRNPGVASTQIDFGLNNPALTAIQMASPTGPGSGSLNAAGSAFKAGMRSSKPIVTRVATSFGKGVQAGGRALINNAPKVVANVGVQSVPLAAVAYSEPTVNQNGSWWDENKGWVIPTALLAGYGSYRYIKGRGVQPSQAVDPYTYSPNKKWFTWERPTKWEGSTRSSLQKKHIGDLRSEWNAAVGDPAKEKAFKDKYGLIVQEQIENGQSTKIFWDNSAVVNALNNNDFTGWKGIVDPSTFILTGPTNSQIKWARTRNLGRVALGVGTPVGGYFLFRQPSRPITDTKANPQISVQSQEEANPVQSDTIELVPRTEVGPVTTSTQEETDSLDRAFFGNY